MGRSPPRRLTQRPCAKVEKLSPGSRTYEGNGPVFPPPRPLSSALSKRGGWGTMARTSHQTGRGCGEMCGSVRRQEADGGFCLERHALPDFRGIPPWWGLEGLTRAVSVGEQPPPPRQRGCASPGLRAPSASALLLPCRVGTRSFICPVPEETGGKERGAGVHLAGWRDGLCDPPPCSAKTEPWEKRVMGP